MSIEMYIQILSSAYQLNICKQVSWSVGGEYIRKSLNLNSWEAASDLVRS